MKKVLLLLAIVFVAVGLASCESGDDDPIKIGYTFVEGNTSGLIGDAAALLKLAEEALGIEVVFNTEADYTAEGSITAVENFIAAGCDGVIVCNFSESSMVNIANLCDQNGVYFAQFYRTLTDEDVIDIVEASQYYVGRVHEDEYTTAYNLVQNLYDAGSRNVGFVSATHGDNTYETRAEGYRDACADLGINIVVEQWDVPFTADCTTTIVNMLTAYSNIDGLIMINNQYAPYAAAACENLGITDLPMVGIDFDTSMVSLLQDGFLVGTAGGHHADPLFALLLVYNAITGAVDTTDFPIDVVNNMLTISSYEEYQSYAEWYAGWADNWYTGQCYNMDEIKALTKTFNDDFTIQDIQDAATVLSVADVLARHSS